MSRTGPTINNDPDHYGELAKNGTILAGGGELLVNGAGLLEAWRLLFVGGERVPPLLDGLNSALSNFSIRKDHVRRDAPNGEKKRYWSLNPEMIIDFAERNQIGEPEVLRERIQGSRLAGSGPRRPFKGVAVATPRN